MPLIYEEAANVSFSKRGGPENATWNAHGARHPLPIYIRFFLTLVSAFPCYAGAQGGGYPNIYVLKH